MVLVRVIDPSALVRGRPMREIDDEVSHRNLLRFQSKPQLLPKCNVERRAGFVVPHESEIVDARQAGLVETRAPSAECGEQIDQFLHRKPAGKKRDRLATTGLALTGAEREIRILAFRFLKFGTALADCQCEARQFRWFAMKLQLEPLDQQRLQHTEKLLLRGLAWILCLRLDIESLVGPGNPIGTTLDQAHGLQLPSDVDQMAEPGVPDDTPAERRCSQGGTGSIQGVDAVTAAVNAVCSRRTGFHGRDFENERGGRRLSRRGRWKAEGRHERCGEGPDSFAGYIGPSERQRIGRRPTWVVGFFGRLIGCFFTWSWLPCEEARSRLNDREQN
jgi:hypothetical protein